MPDPTPKAKESQARRAPRTGLSRAERSRSCGCGTRTSPASAARTGSQTSPRAAPPPPPTPSWPPDVDHASCLLSISAAECTKDQGLRNRKDQPCGLDGGSCRRAPPKRLANLRANTYQAAEGKSAGQRRVMPRRQCPAARLARDHWLAPDQARHRASARRREPKRRDRFPAPWPSIVPCTTWRPCSTIGCPRRLARHRAPSGRSEARCRTVHTGLIATGGEGLHAAWPSMRPTPVRCLFAGRALAVRPPRSRALP